MSWSPDTGNALTNSAISVNSVEQSSMTLWHEFLTGWFDGNAHVLSGDDSLTPPKIDAITFQEGALPDPLDGLYLTIVSSKAGKAISQLWSSETFYVTEKRRLDFYFRSLVKTARSDGHNSQSLCRWGADSLYSLLLNPAAILPLTRKGMSAIRPQASSLVVSGAVALRLVPVSLTYTYSVAPLADVLAHTS